MTLHPSKTRSSRTSSRCMLLHESLLDRSLDSTLINENASRSHCMLLCASLRSHPLIPRVPADTPPRSTARVSRPDRTGFLRDSGGVATHMLCTAPPRSRLTAGHAPLLWLLISFSRAPSLLSHCPRFGGRSVESINPLKSSQSFCTGRIWGPRTGYPAQKIGPFKGPRVILLGVVKTLYIRRTTVGIAPPNECAFRSI